jgi:hypothetical protein
MENGSGRRIYTDFTMLYTYNGLCGCSFLLENWCIVVLVRLAHIEIRELRKLYIYAASTYAALESYSWHFFSSKVK